MRHVLTGSDRAGWTTIRLREIESPDCSYRTNSAKTTRIINGVVEWKKNSERIDWAAESSATMECDQFELASEN
jgi:hypothetical protein